MACCVSLGSATFTTSEYTCLVPKPIAGVRPVANTMASCIQFGNAVSVQISIVSN